MLRGVWSLSWKDLFYQEAEVYSAMLYQFLKKNNCLRDEKGYSACPFSGTQFRTPFSVPLESSSIQKPIRK